MPKVIYHGDFLEYAHIRTYTQNNVFPIFIKNHTLKFIKKQ